MKKLNPEFIKSLKEKVNTSPFYELTSMEIKEIAWGKCIMEVAVRKKHFQPYGMVHGGVYASLVDSAAYWAIFTKIADDARLITIETKLNYLAPASAGYLIAKGKSIKVGRTLCLGETTIENAEGKLVAHGTATTMVLPDLKIEGEFSLPSRLQIPAATKDLQPKN